MSNCRWGVPLTGLWYKNASHPFALIYDYNVAYAHDHSNAFSG